METTGADVDDYKRSLLQAAAENDVASLRPFFSAGATQWEKVRNGDRQHVLHIAALMGAGDAVEMLLSFPKVVSKVNSRDRGKRTALHLAASMGYEGIVRSLVAAKASLDKHDENGCTPLHLAVMFQWVDAVDALLQLGANPLREDIRGDSAIGIANRKRNAEILALLAQVPVTARPRHSAMHSAMLLGRCIAPRWFPAPQGPPPDVDLAEGGDDRFGLGPDGSWPPSAAPSRPGQGARPPDPTKEHCHGALAATRMPQCFSGARAALSGQETSGGLRAETLGAAAGARPPQCFSGARAALSLRETSTAPEARLLQGGSGGSLSCTGGLGALARNYLAGGTQDGGNQCAVFRLHMYFDVQVQRLDLEVEWNREQPAAAAVKDGGEAARRGVLRGDRLVEIAGVRTAGRGREQLLPSLKQRPLLLKVDREARAVGEREAHLELTLTLDAAATAASGTTLADFGLEVAWRGELPVAVAVRPQTRAWAAGVLEGDALVTVDRQDVTRATRAALTAALQRASEIGLWRRPLGADLTAPWHP